jgi:LmbE family N-acetylglucosaminyl deacetylase
VPPLSNPGAQVYVPDGVAPEEALARTTHLAVGAHPDDIPIMASDGIVECFGESDRWFLGITVTDGSGSPRAGTYRDFSDDEMRAARMGEEQKAAAVGEYSAAVFLDYRSSVVRDAANDSVVSDLATLIGEARPAVVYTHNLADKHDTHVAVALRTIAAIRSLPVDVRPAALYGCEVWRDLDWMVDEDKVAFDVTDHGELIASVLASYDSQTGGGRRYDRGVAGRSVAHATFSDPQSTSIPGALAYAMDLTPLILDDSLSATAHVDGHIERMRRETADRIERHR